MTSITLNQKQQRVEVKSLEISNEIVFNYFDKLPVTEREDQLFKALYIGILALKEDRLSTFLSKTANELGTQLESLKIIYDMKKELFFKSATMGVVAENDIAAFLNNYFEKQAWTDRAQLTGNTSGSIPKNKTGDIVCSIGEREDLRIVIECKFDKSLKLGEINSKDVFTKKSDTAWNQLIESAANRDAQVSIIVFDAEKVDPKILSIVQNIKYIPEIGFIVIVKSLAGEYSNLAIAYSLARDIAVNVKKIELDKELLAVIMNRVIKDLTDVISIRSMVEDNIDNNRKILKQLEKSTLSIEFSCEYLLNFLQEGTLSKQDLLAFYSGEKIKDKFKLLEKEINEI